MNIKHLISYRVTFNDWVDSNNEYLIEDRHCPIKKREISPFVFDTFCSNLAAPMLLLLLFMCKFQFQDKFNFREFSILLQTLLHAKVHLVRK